jgi:lipopolysaccharide biosynthesis glycosyltransferase
MVNIALATDDVLLPHIGVVIRSLLANTKEPVTFYIFTRKIRKELFNFKVHKLPPAKYFQVPMDSYRFGRVKLARWVSLSTMDRIFMPSILKHISKIVYLDIDCVVCDDIKKLFDHPTGECGIAAKQSIRTGYLTNIDYAKSTQINHAYLDKLAGEHPNFNAGVMVVDLDKWRKNNCEKIALNLVSATRCNDQIALASYSAGRFERLDKRWNTWVGIDEKTVKKPGILHYVGGVKPWRGQTPLIEEWNKWR